MKVAKNCVVTLEYELKNKEGATIDASTDNGPIVYLHGTESLLPALEEAVHEGGVGDSFAVVIESRDAYGEYDEALVGEVPRENFPGIENIEAGMQFQTQGEGGQPMVVTVVKADETIVVVDGNHPLAGQDLHFSLEVKDVREATEEEIAHGHVHGEGGHEH